MAEGRPTCVPQDKGRGSWRQGTHDRNLVFSIGYWLFCKLKACYLAVAPLWSDLFVGQRASRRGRYGQSEMGMTSRRAMELRFEEYRDADLSLIRDHYETTFSHYVPDLAERIFVVRDALAGGAHCTCAMNRITTTCAAFVCSPLPVPGAGSRLLQHACRDLSDKPVICHALPFEKPFYLRRDLTTFPCMNSTGPFTLSITSSANRGYQIELLVRQAKAPVFN